VTLSKRKVVITGIGAVTPIGMSNDGLWEGIRRERSAVALVLDELGDHHSWLPVTRTLVPMGRLHLAALLLALSASPLAAQNAHDHVALGTAAMQVHDLRNALALQARLSSDDGLSESISRIDLAFRG